MNIEDLMILLGRQGEQGNQWETKFTATDAELKETKRKFENVSTQLNAILAEKASHTYTEAETMTNIGA